MRSPANHERCARPQPLRGRRSRDRRFASLLVILALWLIPIACVQAVSGSSVPFLVFGTRTAIAAPPVKGTKVASNESTRQPNPPSHPQTGTQTALPAFTATPRRTLLPPVLYYSQAGDTLAAVAVRFNVTPAEITSPSLLPSPDSLLDPKVLLIIPQNLGDVSSDRQVIPDSEIVYSPSALDLNIPQFIKEAGGYLYTGYSEWRALGKMTGANTIYQVSIENSINPRLLLAILEEQSHWVYGQPQNMAQKDYPIGYMGDIPEKRTLFFQLSWAVEQLNIGYYGWREGLVTELTFTDHTKLRLAPTLNAGTVALLYLFAQLYDQPTWAGVVYGPDGIMSKYEKMFGSPWVRAETVEPLFPATLIQPPLELPFPPGKTWSFTGGPHPVWGAGGALGALDFAPTADQHGCYSSDEWATAVASGLVVRSENGVVVVDLDGDGYEQTGWSIMYLHVATYERVAKGTWVNLDDPIGHPSCEGGNATGTHIHIARKYNGEWIAADGPLPFVLSGWRTHAGAKPYYGWLTQGDQTVKSSLVGEFFSLVTRPKP